MKINVFLVLVDIFFILDYYPSPYVPQLQALMLRPSAEALMFYTFESFIWDFPSRTEGLQVLSAPCCTLVSYIEFFYFVTLVSALTFCPFIWELLCRKGCDRNAIRRQGQSPISGQSFFFGGLQLYLDSIGFNIWTLEVMVSVHRQIPGLLLVMNCSTERIVSQILLWTLTVMKENAMAPFISVTSDLKYCR